MELMMQRRLNLNLSRTLLMLGSLALLGGAVWLWLRPVQVATAEVTVREISPSIRGVGTVEAKVVVQLATKITGRIVIMNVDQGDTLTVHAQQAALLRAQATLSAAEALVAKTRANRSLANANADRWRKLAATDLVARMDLDERVNAAESADAELKSAEALREAASKEVADWRMSRLRRWIQSGEWS
jgi:HlyD family secretion protein